jgi:Transcriptional regulator
MFNKEGFENTKITDIMKKSNTSVGAFYYYFSSKSDIFSALYEKFNKDYEKTIEKRIDTDDIAENIALYFKQYAHFISQIGTANVKQLFNTRNLLLADKNRLMYKPLVKIIEKGIEKNQLTKNMTAEEIKELLTIVLNGLVYDWLLHEGNYDLGTKMEVLILNLNRVLLP